MFRSLVIMFLVLVAIAVSGARNEFKKPRPNRPYIPHRRPTTKEPALESRDGPAADWAEGFKVLDRNRDGFIDIKELTDDINNFFPGQANRNPADIISEADKDGDGRISYEDFIAAVQTGPSYEER